MTAEMEAEKAQNINKTTRPQYQKEESSRSNGSREQG